MTSFADMLTAIKQAESDLTSGQYVHGLKDAAAIIDGAADLLISVGFKSTCPTDDKVKSECVTVVQSCIDQCNAVRSKTQAISAVGTIGDGHIIDMLLNIFMRLLPLFTK